MKRHIYPNDTSFRSQLWTGRRGSRAAFLRSKWLSAMGPETEALEKEFAEFCGVKHAIALSNCTTALHLANLAVGVKQGDEVICPSLSFVATSNSILYAEENLFSPILNL